MFWQQNETTSVALNFSLRKLRFTKGTTEKVDD